MMRKQLAGSLAATVAVGALTVGAVLPAVAQDGDTTTQDGTAADPRPSSDREGRHAERQAAFAAALAEKLGIDEETVAEALTAIRQDRRTARDERRESALQATLDEAVAAGTITQAQADSVVAVMEADVLMSYDGTLAERLAAAVEAGDITQQQADDVQAVADAGVLRDGKGPRGARRGHHGPRAGFGRGVPATDAHADADAEASTPGAT